MVSDERTSWRNRNPNTANTRQSRDRNPRERETQDSRDTRNNRQNTNGYYDRHNIRYSRDEKYYGGERQNHQRPTESYYDNRQRDTYRSNRHRYDAGYPRYYETNNDKYLKDRYKNDRYTDDKYYETTNSAVSNKADTITRDEIQKKKKIINDTTDTNIIIDGTIIGRTRYDNKNGDENDDTKDNNNDDKNDDTKDDNDDDKKDDKKDDIKDNKNDMSLSIEELEKIAGNPVSNSSDIDDNSSEDENDKIARHRKRLLMKILENERNSITDLDKPSEPSLPILDQEMVLNEKILPSQEIKKDNDTTVSPINLFALTEEKLKEYQIESNEDNSNTDGKTKLNTVNIDVTADEEGYQIQRPGDNIGQGKYIIKQQLGRGSYSSVILVKHIETDKEYAVKVIRRNETTLQSGKQEQEILSVLKMMDPEKKRLGIIRLYEHFEYNDHICMVFPSYHCDVRSQLRTLGGIGISMDAVRKFGRQLLYALSFLKDVGVLHMDIKPDNLLVDTNLSCILICDFGSAQWESSYKTISTYIASRFYRAPEILIGIPYSFASDYWAMGCVFYELYTGKILFPGNNSNDMLKRILEVKGAFPKRRVLSKGVFTSNYFDENGLFMERAHDPLTGKVCICTGK